MKSVFEASIGIEAHMVKNLLAMSEVESEIFGEHLQGGVGDLQAGGIIRVMVADRDYSAAHKIVTDWEASQPAENHEENNKRASNFCAALIGFIVGVGLILFLTKAPIMHEGIDDIGDEKLSQHSPSWEKEINAAIANELEKSGTPSLQVAIGKKDRVVFASTQGLADVENNVAATNYSKYRVGSVSKWFTSAAAKALIADGVLDPEIPVQAYCPQFPKKQWPITTSDLLTHRSGIRHYVDYESELEKAISEQARNDLYRDRDRDQLSSYKRYVDVITPLESFKSDPLLFEPNTSWTYSSLGYRVLACVLEGAAKSTYSELMSDLIFKKANMANTVKDDAWAIISDRVTGYRLDRDKTLRRAGLRDTSENLPAGGHLSTTRDLVKFGLALNSGKILTRNTSWFNKGLENSAWKAVAKHTIGQDSSWRNAIPSEGYYGVGEMFFPDESRLWVGHTGRIAGGSAIVMLQPESELVIAVATNAKGWNGYISFIDKLKLILEKQSKLL